jgi:glycosyltransferase involved in cell wall biosynthesis
MPPKFSVLLPTKNRLELLKQAVETVRRQSYSDWEIIVADNASTEPIADYVASLREPRIRYVRSDVPLPVTASWNAALEKSSGEYVIMLGDDDGLLRDHLLEASRRIEQFSQPELVLTDALLYSYPGVMPDHELGFLQIPYGRFFDNRNQPYLLPRAEALDAVRSTLAFKQTFQFNMQFSVISRRLIERTRAYGRYFQSPYPDFYASNANLVLAKTVLVIPQPMVCIGISPKSYGYYYFNEKQKEGAEILANTSRAEDWTSVRQYIVPGNDLFSCWLASVETVRANFAGLLPDLCVAYRRYRVIQAWDTAQKGDEQTFEAILGQAKGTEHLTFRIIRAILLVPPRHRRRFFRRAVRKVFRGPLNRLLTPYPSRDTRVREIPARNMIEVFESVPPAYY